MIVHGEKAMYNKYPEDFKRQAVIACQTSGLTKGQVCRSLGIPPTTLDHWMCCRKYNPNLPQKETPEQIKERVTNLIRVGLENKVAEQPSLSAVRISTGDICVEFMNGATVEELRAVLMILKGN